MAPAAAAAAASTSRFSRASLLPLLLRTSLTAPKRLDSFYALNSTLSSVFQPLIPNNQTQTLALTLDLYAAMAPTAPPDGETRTSRIVGSVGFVRPKLPVERGDAAAALKIVRGVRCSMPFTIKCAASSFAGGDDGSAVDAERRMTDVADEVFEAVETKLSSFHPSSEVNLVNALPAGKPHAMSPELLAVVLGAKEMIKLTRGAYDPAIAPLLAHYEERARGGGSRSESTASSGSGGDGDGGGTVDAETIRRQRAVVEVWTGLLEQGFGDPTDNRVSKKVRELLEISQWISSFSVGHFDEGDHKVLTRPRLSWVKSAADEAGVKIMKLHDDARMDLSGITKGWAVEEIARKLPSPCFVEWGGDVKVRGSHPSGRPWVVAVPEPPSLAELRDRVALAEQSGQKGPVFTLAHQEAAPPSQQYLAVLKLRDGDAVATSGDSEKVVQKSGRLYSHVINPQLGRLMELNDVTLAQATVVCRSCMFADALATAAVSKEDPARARAMLEPFRTGFREPVSDFLLYSRSGPRVVKMSVPGVEPEADRERRLARHRPARVVVVGSGLAGMSAAIEAADAGADVVLLEKEPKTGGNSAKATSGINGWGTDTQAHQGVADEERLFERDTFRSGLGGHSNPSLVRALSSKSAPAIHWLKRKFDIPLTVLSQLGGHSAKRTHRAPPDAQGRPVPIGYHIMSTLKKTIETEYKGKIEVRCGQTVSRLLHSEDEEGVKTVTGVEVNGHEFQADSVVLATGGFGCSRSPDGLMNRFRPDLLGCPTTNGEHAQGDGVLMGEQIGAELIDMDKVQLHPTGFIDPKNPSNPTKFLAPEAIRGSGGVLVNSEGKRFVNELTLRSVVAKAIQQHCGPYRSDEYVGPAFAWCILSGPAQELFGPPVLGFYKDRLGLFEDCEDVKAAAAVIGCDESALNETLRAYADAAEDGYCPLTHKAVFPAELTPESKGLVLARVTPSIHYTMGGLSINAAGEVQERIEGMVGSHRHIRGLYAAGEVTGGVHGNNRLGGNSLLECVVFGRIAGERAATVNQPDRIMFPKAQVDDGEEEDGWVPVVLREVRNTDKQYGMNTREVRFNLHGALQKSGLDVGQFIALRGEMDGETLMGYYSPITRPEDEGVLGVLCRVDQKGGPITRLLQHVRPGSVMHMCAMGGLRLKFQEEGMFFRGRKIERIGLLAGGTGIAPMLQIIRAYGQHLRRYGSEGIPKLALNLIYAAEEESDLAYMKILHDIRDAFPEHFRFYVVLNRPPIGWTEGVGYIEPRHVRKYLVFPPKESDLCIMCGPPIFEDAMRKTLERMGFDKDQWFSFSADDHVSAHL